MSRHAAKLARRRGGVTSGVSGPEAVLSGRRGRQRAGRRRQRPKRALTAFAAHCLRSGPWALVAPPVLFAAAGPLASPPAAAARPLHPPPAAARSPASRPPAAAQQPGGHAALRSGDYEQAIRILRPAALDGDPAALAGWVAALRETGDLDGAVSASERGVDIGAPGARALLGASLMAVGRLDEARTVLEVGAGEPGAPGAAARVELGIVHYRHGDRDAARALFDGFIDHYNSSPALTAAELTAVGRALVHLSRWDYEYAHDALRALDEAVAAAPLDHTARIAAGELFLERYDARQAADAFAEVLAANPSHARARLGMARVARLEGGGAPIASLEAALDANPNLAAARTLLARLRLMGGDHAGAAAEIDRVLQVNPADMDALGTRAALLHLAGDGPGFERAMADIRAVAPVPTGPLVLLAELAADHRKYADALDFALQATRADPGAWTAWGLAGLNQVRMGRVDEGRLHLERAFAGDPFNLWFKNTLDLLDTFGEYRVVSTEHFDLVLHESEAELLAPYMEAVAESAWAQMAARYGEAPEPPIRVEVYPRHADFSVRTVGMVGIGALGVSFGPALAIDSPAARDVGDFNWASTLWHEIAHSFHLAISRAEVPRWFSEGLAVHEQRKAAPGPAARVAAAGDGGERDAAGGRAGRTHSWGHQASVGFARSLASGRMRPVSELDKGFSSPRHPGEVVESYYQASLVFEIIEERHGFPAIVAMLRAYRDGASNPEAFERALGVRMEDFDADFDAFVRDRFAAAIASVGAEPVALDGAGGVAGPRRTGGGGGATGAGGPDVAALKALADRHPGRFGPRMALGRALHREGRPAEAAPHFEAALELFPQYGGPDGAHWHLGRIRWEEGDLLAAAEHLRALLRLNESHYEGRLALSEVLVEAGDSAGAVDALRDLPHVHPYGIEDHERVAALAEATGEMEAAVGARRAVVALDPVDRAAAHYRLARALLGLGDRAEARRAVLAALEIAPNYEEALELLLALRGRGP